MERKRVIVGESEWTIEESKVDDVLAQIKAALEGGTVAALPLLDDAGRSVTVYLNGRVVPTVVVDIDRDPRPGEISGRGTSDY